VAFFYGGKMEISLPLTIFLTAFGIIFLGVSVYCVGLWLRSVKGLKTLLEDQMQHWSLKLAIYYGIAFFIFLVSSVLMSFVVLLAITIWRG